MCRPQNIMVCLGKRCKANCTFSAEKYTWFTVWNPPLPTITWSCSLTTNKTEHKRPVFFTILDMWQFQNASAQSVSTLSEHFQSHWDAFTYSNTTVPTHTLRIKCGKKATVHGVLLLSCSEISGRQIPQKWHPRQQDCPHMLSCVQSTRAKRAVTARPAFVLSLNKARHVYIQSVSLCGARSYFRGS